MATLTLQMQMSVDGKVAAADPDLDWLLWDWVPPSPWDPGLLATFNETLDPIDHVLLSRPMVEGGYVDHWTTVAREHGGDPDYAFAERITMAQKVVVTDQELHGTWARTSTRGGGLDAAVRSVKDESDGGVVAFGGTSFATALLELGLVDELQLYVNPTAAGQGSTIFSAGMRFALLKALTYDCGIVVMRYVPKASTAPSPAG